MSLTLREMNLLKQRRKKSGPPYGVDFKRELTSSVLTSRGFHCISLDSDKEPPTWVNASVLQISYFI